jgi:hypothetical protein
MLAEADSSATWGRLSATCERGLTDGNDVDSIARKDEPARADQLRRGDCHSPLTLRNDERQAGLSSLGEELREYNLFIRYDRGPSTPADDLFHCRGRSRVSSG